MLANAGLAFFVQPLGDPPPALKYGHNVVLALGMIVLLMLTSRAYDGRSDRLPSTHPE
ncbi:hypothetical protein [Actinopolymorpha alba]|uniref:hypothetical protein n=1 Tax=Actinopolymorpha alba TaxID=533267 RepID=UPI00037592DA|nr:hypothetical protein [Actinopolymorpha alba]